MAAPLSSLFIQIAANTATLRSDMGKATRIIENNARQWDRRLAVLKRSIGGLFAGLGAAVGLREISSAISEIVAKGDALSKLGRTIGVSPEALQSWRYVSGQISGIDTSQADKALMTLSRRVGEVGAGVGEAKKFFDAFGISVRDSAGNLKPVEEVLADITNRIASTKNEQEAAILASKAFGEELGVKLVGQLRMGQDAITEVGNEVTHLTNVNAQALENMRSAWDKVWADIAGRFGNWVTNILRWFSKLTGMAFDTESSMDRLLDLQEKYDKLIDQSGQKNINPRYRNRIPQDIKKVADEIQKETENLDKMMADSVTKINRTAIELDPFEAPARKAGGGGGRAAAAKATKSLVDAEKELARSLESTKQALDPVYAATQRYSETLSILQQGMAAGLIPSQERFNELVELARDQMDKALESANKMGDETKKSVGFMEELADTVKNQVSVSFGNWLDDAVQGTLKLQDALKGLLADLAKIVLKASLNKALGDIFPSLNALGNAFPGGTSLPHGVYRHPTPFRFAKGGILGEAGPEAILPLTRTSGGKLGVQAQTSPVNIVINNNSSSQISTRETRTSGGGRTLEVEINDAVRREMRKGGFDRTMSSNFGLSRRGF